MKDHSINERDKLSKVMVHEAMVFNFTLKGLRNNKSVPHPMLEEHYIQWIEVLVGNKAYREFLKPGQKPQASFSMDLGDEPIVLREYCNIHGLWKVDPLASTSIVIGLIT